MQRQEYMEQLMYRAAQQKSLMDRVHQNNMMHKIEQDEVRPHRPKPQPQPPLARTDRSHRRSHHSPAQIEATAAATTRSDARRVATTRRCRL